jgi:drug/metabolite transporter (DMT)-like permease
MIALLFAFIAFFAWAVGDFTSFVLSRRYNASTVMFYSFPVRLLIYLLLSPLFWPQLKLVTPSTLIIGVIVGCCSALGYYLFFQASRLANPALVASISGSWGAPSLLISLLFLGETITKPQFFFILTIFAGIILSSYDFSLKTIVKTHRSGILLSFLIMLLWGICGSFIKIPIHQFGWYWSTVLLVVPFTVIYLLNRRYGPKPILIRNPKSLIPLFFYAALIVLAETSYNVGISRGFVSIIAPIAGSYSVLLVLLTFLIFKDPLKRQQLIGIITTLIGIVGLSLFSV